MRWYEKVGMAAVAIGLVVFIVWTVTTGSSGLAKYNMGKDAQAMCDAMCVRWDSYQVKSAGLQVDIPLDPWGRPFEFTVLMGGVREVRSYGYDGLQFTADDLIATDTDWSRGIAREVTSGIREGLRGEKP